MPCIYAGFPYWRVPYCVLKIPEGVTYAIANAEILM